MRDVIYGLIRGFCALAVTVLWGAGMALAQSPLPSTPLVQVIPHIASGGNFVTKFTIVNQSASANAIVFNNVRDDGTLIDSTPFTIPGNGVLRLNTVGPNTPFEDHWALVGSQLPVGINLFFEITQSGTVINTVGFNDVPAKTSFTMPVEFEPQPAGAPIGRTFGLAVANVSNATNNVSIKLFDRNGALLTTVNRAPLAAFGKFSVDLTTDPSFKAVLPNGNFVGSITVTSSQPSSAIGVGDDFGPFFSVPALNVAQSSSSNQALTVTLASSDPDGGVIGSANCITRGVAAPGATTASTVVISPAGDPVANGLFQTIWEAYPDTNGHVTAQFCQLGHGTAFPTKPQVFNIRVLNSPQASASATLTLPTGTQVLAGTCITSGMGLTGARTSKVVQVSAASDPAASFGVSPPAQVYWSGFADAADHVTLQFCHFGGGPGTFLTARAPQTFNISVID